MKEVMAIIRAQKVNATKDALADAGYPAFFAVKVLGRGKKHIGEIMAGDVAEGEDLPRNVVGESFTERTRLVPKRLLTVIANDDDVDKVVEVLISTNQTGQPGDGKIFISPVVESYRVRDQIEMKEAV